ncbi:MAG: hypothetical protein V2I45_06130 [Halieaceae bacterium]|jgi:hypothetical protein|nr:hypothetical protein [Halieaceae bacterium]
MGENSEVYIGLDVSKESHAVAIAEAVGFMWAIARMDPMEV